MIKQKRNNIILLVCLFIVFVAAAVSIFVTQGIAARGKRYPVVGIDVSHYQGDIDWQVISSYDINTFAYIKATEGSSYADEKFDYNFTEAQKTELRVGAYHFFSFESSGKSQAENFIRTVTAFDGMLPPAIDLEYYGDFRFSHPSPEEVKPELDAMISALTEHYGMPPIIYCTMSTYKKYIMGDYPDCDIWIRSICFEPKLPDGREWTFWQDSDKTVMQGYSGEEKYIDTNRFNGTPEDFQKYAK